MGPGARPGRRLRRLKGLRPRMLQRTKRRSRARLLFDHQLFDRQGVTRLDQPVEFFLLLRHAPGCSFFILRARRGGGLFDQLPDVVPQYSDTVVEFG